MPKAKPKAKSSGGAGGSVPTVAAAIGAGTGHGHKLEGSEFGQAMMEALNALPSLVKCVKTAILTLTTLAGTTGDCGVNDLIAATAVGEDQEADCNVESGLSVEGIGDTGAGAHVGSIQALIEQGVLEGQVHIEELESPQRFRTGGGTQYARSVAHLWNETLGWIKMFLLDNCPIAFCLGEEVNGKKRTLVWEPDKLPYLAIDPDKIRIECPDDNKWQASRVKKNVPYWTAHCSNGPSENPEAAQCAQEPSINCSISINQGLGGSHDHETSQAAKDSNEAQSAQLHCKGEHKALSVEDENNADKPVDPEPRVCVECLPRDDDNEQRCEKSSPSELLSRELKAPKIPDKNVSRNPRAIEVSHGHRVVDEIFKDTLDALTEMNKNTEQDERDFIGGALQEMLEREAQWMTESRGSDSISAMPISGIPKHSFSGPNHGTCIEFCTAENSTLGATAEKYGLNVIRLTEQFGNCADSAFIEQLLEQVKAKPGVDIWGSIPCTAWSSWQHMCAHIHGPEYRKQLQRARLLSRKILKHFIKVAEVILQNGGRIAFEWPRHATGWHLDELRNFITKWDLKSATFDGCYFGMTNSKGEIIRKQWRVVTSCSRLSSQLDRCKCQHGPEFKHGTIQGSETAKTATYPRDLCETILTCWYPDEVHQHVPMMICTPCSEQPEEHREKETSSYDFADIPIWTPCGIISAVEEAVTALPGTAEGSEEAIAPETDSIPEVARREHDPFSEEPLTMSRTEQLRAEAKSIKHMMLHSKKNCMCEFCLRGRMLSHYTHSVRPEGEDKPMPTKYGMHLGADYIIASEESKGSGGEKAALHVRDHYSGGALTYPLADRSEDYTYKCLKHFGGTALNGSAETTVKCDNAGELTNAIHRMAWVPDPSLANSWPHNTACERDIRTTKEQARPAHLQAGFWKKMWPATLDYMSKARTFFEAAPVYEYEKGTPAETEKTGKTKFEVITGEPFLGVEYPLGALVFYRSKPDGIAEASTKPGIFAGWKLDSGFKYREVVQILDYESLRMRNHKHWEPKMIHQKEVYFPSLEHIEFPFQNAASKTIKDVSDPEYEIRKAEYDRSIERGVLPYEVSIDSIPLDSSESKGLRHAPITELRKIELGPTPGCPGCDKGTYDHNDICRARFNAAYLKKKVADTKTEDKKEEDEPTARDAKTSSATAKPIGKSGPGISSSGGSSSSTAPPSMSPENEALLNELVEDLAAIMMGGDESDMTAMVTRLLDRSETLSNPEAIKAIRKEADGLLSKGTWDIKTVMEQRHLLQKARKNGEKLHLGSLMTICSEKFAEMDAALRVLKGRVVFRGDCTKDQDGTAAVFQNLTASPTSITSANANIAYGRIPGNKTSSADAVKAYVQALLKAKNPTWVKIPFELWEPGWESKFSQPVCLLIKALYGHPESGSHWENHLTKVVRKLGGVTVPEHPSSFWFEDAKLLLTVYVDDFLLSGPIEAHEDFWSKLSKEVEVEDIGGLGRFLGRYHDIVTIDDQEHVCFGMKDYVKSACDMYEQLPGASSLKPAPTPFLPDGSLPEIDDFSRGALADDACKVLMKCLWAARLARPDILKPIISLARKVTRWSKNCDRQLARLMGYLKATTDYTLVGTVNDAPEDLHLRLFVDADFAGDREDAYSTSGGWLVLAGPRTYFPLCWVSKKQTAVSRSTTEAEVVSLAYSLFKEALPMCALWDKLMGREMELYICEDNKAAITICENGFSAKLRHISRTHKVNLQSIKDEVTKENTHLQYTDTLKQAADIFTKGLEPHKWDAALRMLGVLSKVPEPGCVAPT